MYGAREQPPVCRLGSLDNQVTLRRDQINCCSSQLIRCNLQLVWFRPNSTMRIKEHILTW